MAGYTGELVIGHSISTIYPIHDGQTRLAGVLLRGIIDPVVSIPGSITSWRAKNANSDLAGYKKLITGFGFELSETLTGNCNPTSGPCEVAIEEFATDAGDMDDVRSNNSTTTFRFRGRYTGTPAPGVAELRCKVYHRNTGGSETLLAWFSQAITLTTTNFTKEVTINKSWELNERLVVKWSAYFEGPLP